MSVCFASERDLRHASLALTHSPQTPEPREESQFLSTSGFPAGLSNPEAAAPHASTPAAERIHSGLAS